MGTTRWAATNLASILEDNQIDNSLRSQIQAFFMINEECLNSKFLTHQVGELWTKSVVIQTDIRVKFEKKTIKSRMIEEDSIFEDFLLFGVHNSSQFHNTVTTAGRIKNEMRDAVQEIESKIVSHRLKFRKNYKDDFYNKVEAIQREKDKVRESMGLEMHQLIKNMLNCGSTLSEIQGIINEYIVEEVHKS